MEPESSFIRSQSRIELHSVSPVNLHLSLIVLPDHTELDDAFRNGSNLQGSLVLGIFLEEGGVFKG